MADLADLYGVPTKVLNQAVKRNAGRFPPDFMFQLEPAEKTEVVTNCDHLQKLKFSKSMLPQPLVRAHLAHGRDGVECGQGSGVDNVDHDISNLNNKSWSIR